VPIDQQPTEQESRVGGARSTTNRSTTNRLTTDRAGTNRVGTDQALAEAREWLQQHGVGEPAGVAGQPARQSSERLAVSSARPLSGPPPKQSMRSQAADADAESPSAEKLACAEKLARTIALRKLTTRACSRRELDQALQAKRVPQDVRDAVLDRLEESGLVDDASFAADWVASRQQRRHLSRRALRRELEAKGVERSEIGTALDNVDRNAELTSARELVERKQAGMSGLARDVQYRRLAGILSRRGFDTALIGRVLSDVLGE
jgi:regulatory protein